LCVLFEAGDFLVQHFHVLAEFVDLAGEVVVVLTFAVAGAMLLFHTFDEFPYVTGFFGESGKGEMFACFPQVAETFFGRPRRLGARSSIRLACLAWRFGCFLWRRWTITRRGWALLSVLFPPAFRALRSALRSIRPG